MEENTNPKYTISTEESQQEQSLNSEVPDSELEQPIFTGDEIYENGLGLITHHHDVKLVLLMGDSEAGKTTFIASIFDKFQKGPCGDYIFGGSRTQIGFEKRCFLARWIGTGRLMPDTERTKSLDMHYLHLAVRKKDGSNPIEHLIFSDVSGEQFRLIRDLKAEMEKFNVINRADQIFYLVNGESLIDSGQRHAVKASTINLIQRAIDTKKLTSDRPFDIVITKYDKVHESTESINSFFVTELKAKFSDYIKGFHYVASRSQNTMVNAGTGLDSLINLVLQRQVSSPVFNASVTSKREFQRFLANPI